MVTRPERITSQLSSSRLEHTRLIQAAGEASSDELRQIKLRQADIISSKILALERAMDEHEDQNPYLE